MFFFSYQDWVFACVHKPLQSGDAGDNIIFIDKKFSKLKLKPLLSELKKISDTLKTKVMAGGAEILGAA